KNQERGECGPHSQSLIAHGIEFVPNRKNKNSLGRVVRQFLQKIAHCDGDFLYMRFECKVSGIQELDSRVRVIASEGFPSVLHRLFSDDVLDLRHVALGGRGGLLWRAPALASVYVRRVPIPPVMLGVRLLERAGARQSKPPRPPSATWRR